ncbi:hypothetical protein AnigIFM63326_001543 [Aspergillus niger]|nr:hypothetical protein AnigIFM63326_001543 [Aspergillus niger]
MTLSEALSIFQILQEARSFAEDETIFQLDDFYKKIMNNPAFSKAVVKIIIKAFTTETSRLRNILRFTGGGSETKDDDESSRE